LYSFAIFAFLCQPLMKALQVVLKPENLEMSEIEVPVQSLEDVRREIDALDEGILNLLERRFAAIEHVRVSKMRSATLGQSPVRPTREANVLRRLLARSAGGHVPPDFLVRLWRGLIATSTLIQAPVTIHVSKKLHQAIGHRLRMRDYFGTMPVEDYRDEAQALQQIKGNPGDLCVVETDSPWAEGFLAGKAGDAKVIACLPFLKDGAAPQLLVIGHAASESSGEDETLILTNGKLPRDFTPTPLWQVKIGPHRLSSLPGNLSEQESPLVGLMRSNASLGLKVVGRYPSPFEVQT
jgi:chorismate mutase / prephenate dehydratase